MEFIGVLILLILVITTLVVYNKFVKNKNMVTDAWSNIDVYLKRRHELVPMLVSSVKLYMAHEHQTLERITNARNQAVSALEENIEKQIETETQLSEDLEKLEAAVEAYPELKADENFLKLQKDLSEIEETLARARRYYNGTVRVNNIFGESIPGVFFAKIFPYKHFEYFGVEMPQGDIPDINLTN